MILRRHVQPLARKLRIKKTIGWHTFRCTLPSLLKANGEDVKVVQELCRHVNPITTMSTYARAFTEDARRAQNKVVVVRHAAMPKQTNQQEQADLARACFKNRCFERARLQPGRHDPHKHWALAPERNGPLRSECIFETSSSVH